MRLFELRIDMKFRNILIRCIACLKFTQRFERRSDECIIFGSGPSLDLLELDSPFFKDKDLIGCNFIQEHKLFAQKKFQLYSLIDKDYSSEVDGNYFANLNSEYVLISTKNMYQLSPLRLISRRIRIVKSMPFEQAKYDCEKAIRKEIFTGNSVPFLIQCAVLLSGYKKIYLLGIDHYERRSENGTYNFSGYSGRKLKKLHISNEKLSYIEDLYRYVFSLCKQHNVTILNATPNTRLDVIPKHEIPQNG